MHRSIIAIGTATAGLLLLVAGCATRQRPVAVVAPPPVTVARVAPSLPPGASPGMTIPAQLADGSFETPNRDLSPAATMWHLRAGLNVAALACRGPDEAGIIARYNALLAAQKPAFAIAQASYAAEFRVQGGDWQDRYDDHMTRLYNFFSLSPARPQFCAAAAAILADSTTIAPGGLEAFAATRLAQLDAPFVAFFRAYDAWRRGSAEAVALAPRPAVIAAAASPSVAVTSQPVPKAIPWLRVDPAVFR